MANTKRNRKRTRQKGNDPAHTEIISIVLLGSGLLYLLALISFTPDDLPTWVPFGRLAEPNSTADNFVGRLGAVGAGFSYYVLGAASYLIPACLIWFGAAKLLFGARTSFRALTGFGLVMLSACCLLDYQNWFFKGWPENYNIVSAGGIIGAWIGTGMFASLTGTVGAFIIMLIVYFTGTVMVTGLHPMHFIKLCRDALKAWREKREALLMARATESERLVKQKRKLEREQKRIEKKLGGSLAAENTEATPKIRRKPVAEEPEGPEKLPLDPLDAESGDACDNTRPAFAEANPSAEDEQVKPKIYDASIRSDEESGKRKPSIAEVLNANKAKAANNKGTGFTAPAEVEFPGYRLPDIELLTHEDQSVRKPADKNLLIQTQNIIIETLNNFNVKVTAGDITRGPTITRYEIYPSKGLRVSRITQLEADIARATRAERINILAPIPGKDTVGIEIANSEKITVALRELFEDPAFTDPKHKIPLALGKDVYGNTVIGDLAKMPHMLVAGTTGAGKSVCINAIISSMLYRFTPDELRFIMIDPKIVEMKGYNSLPHQIVPVITEPKKVLLALRWVVNEMERRYQLFAKLDLRNFDSFNEREHESGEDKFFDPSGQAKLDFNAAAEADPETGEKTAPGTEDDEWEYEYEEVEVEYEEDDGGEPAVAAHSEDILTTHPVRSNSDSTPGPGATERHREGEIAASIEDVDEEKIPDRLPYIVVIIDELADLMQTAPVDVEQAIARIAQKARAAGIHLIIGTQTPRADVVTGIIKANIPSRVAFQVSSALDSRVILDQKGAEKLVGKGDMLYLPPGSAQLIRAQGALITDPECKAVVDFCSSQAQPIFEQEIKDTINSDEDSDEVSEEDEEIIEKCLEVIQQEQRASTSLLQRRLRLGYTRAARMMDILEMRGIIGPGDGAKAREILVDLAD
ncbi:MAG: DNA translocase FtsK [Verrucomicrobiales bacterium]